MITEEQLAQWERDPSYPCVVPTLIAEVRRLRAEAKENAEECMAEEWRGVRMLEQLRAVTRERDEARREKWQAEEALAKMRTQSVDGDALHAVTRERDALREVEGAAREMCSACCGVCRASFARALAKLDEVRS